MKGCELYCGDCLEVMHQVPDKSVDLVLCDLPYGTTQNKWDSVIPFEPLWAQYKRICKGAIVLTAAQPFTSALVMSNPKDFKYQWVWQKQPSGNLNAKKRPMVAHEDVLVFGHRVPYFPQDLISTLIKRTEKQTSRTANYGNQTPRAYTQTATNYPASIISFSKDGSGLHPTQKPVALMEYLIKTYTNAGDTVLDNCMGSGTTGIACVNTGRRFIGIEKDAAYFSIAKDRIAACGSEDTQTPIQAEMGFTDDGL